VVRDVGAAWTLFVTFSFPTESIVLQSKVAAS